MPPIGPVANTVLSALSRVTEARASSDVGRARLGQPGAPVVRTLGASNMDAAREAARAAFAAVSRSGPEPERPVPTAHPQGAGKIHPRGTFLNITV